MQQVIEITAPFFGLIFLGTFLKSIKFLNEEKTTFLSRFAFYVLMPVMLFSNISCISRPFNTLLNSNSIPDFPMSFWFT